MMDLERQLALRHSRASIRSLFFVWEDKPAAESWSDRAFCPLQNVKKTDGKRAFSRNWGLGSRVLYL
jgi:hypothetical protein